MNNYTVFIGSDHRGFTLKEELKTYLVTQEIDFIDCGNHTLDKEDDYPDFAQEVAEHVQHDLKKRRGILICGSGQGMAIAANKFKGIRAGLCHTSDDIKTAVEEDNINILCLSADIIKQNQIQDLITTFLETKFKSEKKYIRRLGKIEKAF